MKILRKGDNGPEVRTLQEKLTAAGHQLKPIDGIFGPKTDEAVKNFQRLKNLKVDGVVGANTYAALEIAIILYKNPIKIITIRKGSQGRLVHVLQELLTATGYTVKPHTQFFGNKTETAVRNFQRRNRLLSDGVVGPATWNALGVSNEANLLNSLDYLVASLGSIGAQSAVLARYAPNTNESSKPVQQLRTSPKGLRFIYTREAAPGKSNRLHWPGMDSGVTLGPGYDMKEKSEIKVELDLLKIGVPAGVAKKVAKGSRLSGIKAKEFCNSNSRRITNPINNGKIAFAMKAMKASNTSGGKFNRGLAERRSMEIALYTMGNYGKLRIV